ncbi:MAG TPA: hypothetical protein K8V07_12180 [Bacteroides xylanisolvens]|uniref:Uncharacterized protein n=1 Tax=Bacteroides xylanisolvens TaxID=371601 RepID=A0A921I771_9BACE|nr:hypothetical protein [Bacteroides xylanisolvens]
MQNSKQALQPISTSLNSTDFSRELISYFYLMKNESNPEEIEEEYSEYIDEFTDNDNHLLPAHLISSFTNISVKFVEHMISSPTRSNIIKSYLLETQEWFKTYYACELNESVASSEAYIKGYAHGTIEFTKKISDLYYNAVISKQLLTQPTIKDSMHFFCAIATSPNISHYELAQELDLSQDELQDFIDCNNLDKSGLYLTAPKGRIRHYKLSDLGNSLVFQYKKQELDNFDSQLKNAFLIKEPTTGKSNNWLLSREIPNINALSISTHDLSSFFQTENETWKPKIFLRRHP